MSSSLFSVVPSHLEHFQRELHLPDLAGHPSGRAVLSAEESSAREQSARGGQRATVQRKPEVGVTAGGERAADGIRGEVCCRHKR